MRKTWYILAGFLIGVAVMLPFTLEFQTILGTDSSIVRTGNQYVVTHVVDGDTIDVKDVDGNVSRVRFVGINTPETVDPRRGVQCYGPEASKKMHEWLTNKTVILTKKPDEDKDKYGRILRYVELDGIDVGATMIKEGFAESYCKRYPHPRCKSYDALEAQAKTAKLGMWGACAK